MPFSGYILGAGLFAFMALGLVTYHYKVEARDAIVLRDAAIRDKEKAIAVNKRNEEIMGKLKADRDRADKIAAALADEVEAANNSTLALANKLAELRANDADVDAFLKLPLPAALRKLYLDPKAVGRDGIQNGRP